MLVGEDLLVVYIVIEGGCLVFDIALFLFLFFLFFGLKRLAWFGWLFRCLSDDKLHLSDL